MSLGLIVIGDEILSGKRRDQHLQKVIELLGARGMSLGWARFVGDEPRRITGDLAHAFELARSQGEVVFSCGGIGATPDDHTRRCAAQALGVPLVLHPQARDLITERMRDIAQAQGRPFEPQSEESNRRLEMGVFPQGAGIIPNPYNKIPGFSVRFGSGGVYFVPGFPVMAWPMIEWVLDTHCAHLRPAMPGGERSVIVFGAMESALTPLMERIETEFPGIKVFSLPSVDHATWGPHIELGVKGEEGLLGRAYAALRSALQKQGVRVGPELVHREGQESP